MAANQPTTTTSSSSSATQDHHTHDASIHGPALSGWQSHQSHGQLTIVFYVDLAVRSEDLHVVIASTYVIAGIRGYEPVLKARLYARIDPATSYWQLERPAHRSRSRTRSRTTSGGRYSVDPQDASSGNDAAGTAVRRPDTSASHRRSRPRSDNGNGSGSGSGSGSNEAASSPELNRHSSRPASPSNSSGSYEMLQRSLASLNTSFSGSGSTSSAGGDSFPHPTTTRPPDLHHPRGGGDPLVSPGSQGSLRSLGEESSERFGVTSMQSSQLLGSAASVSQQSSGDPGSELTAKLLTVHLTKIDGGMWPLLVSGPAPLLTNDNTEDDERSGSDVTSSSQAIPQEDSYEAHPGSSFTVDHPFRVVSQGEQGGLFLSLADDATSPSHQYRLSAADSTLSFQSDDSTTVLGRRRTSLDTTARDEARFNMDPVSLALIGYQLKSAGTARPGMDEAFEYFVRSWRKADLPVATRVLVQEYLPLIHQDTSAEGGADDVFVGHASPPATARPFSAHRLRMIAALGGRTALARLYVSYARLSLSTASTAQRRSSLFPWGSGHTRNPYQPHGQYPASSTSGGFVRAPRSMAHYASSPPHSPSSTPSSPQSGGGDEGPLSEAQLILRFGPLAYLYEARKIEPSIQILPEEWEEAKGIAEEARLELEAEQGEDVDEAGEEEMPGGESIFYAAAHSGSGVGGVSEGGQKLDSHSPHLPPSAFEDGQQNPRRRRRTKRGVTKGEEGKGRRKTSTRSGGGGGGITSPPSTSSRKRSEAGEDASAKGGGGGLISILGSAAFFSIVVAGSVAALGWWRRGGGAGGGGLAGGGGPGSG